MNRDELRAMRERLLRYTSDPGPLGSGVCALLKAAEGEGSVEIFGDEARAILALLDGEGAGGERLAEALRLIHDEKPADMLAFIWRHGHRMELRHGYGDQHDNNPESYELVGDYHDDARYNHPRRGELRDKVCEVALAALAPAVEPPTDSGSREAIEYELHGLCPGHPIADDPAATCDVCNISRRTLERFAAAEHTADEMYQHWKLAHEAHVREWTRRVRLERAAPTDEADHG